MWADLYSHRTITLQGWVKMNWVFSSCKGYPIVFPLYVPCHCSFKQIILSLWCYSNGISSVFLILCTTSTLRSLQISGARRLRGHALILISASDYNESSVQEELTNLFFHIFWDPPSSLFQGMILIQTPGSIQWTKKIPLQISSSPSVTCPGHVWALMRQALC